jgi:hypothetical protein
VTRERLPLRREPPGQKRNLRVSRPAAPLRSELILGLSLIAVAVVGLYNVMRDPLLHEDVGPDPGPAFFPAVLLALFGLGGAVQVVMTAWRAIAAARLLPDAEFRARVLAVPVLLFATLLLYAWALPRAGYVVASLATAFGWLAITDRGSGRARAVRGWLQYLAEAVAIVLVLYALFRYGVRVPLP